MQTSAPKQTALDIFVLSLFIGVLALGVTYLEVVKPSLKDINNWASSLTTFNAPKPVSTQAQPKAATPAPVAAPVVKTATTNQTVHFRTAKDTSSQIIQDLDPGTVVQLRDDSDAKWQGVTYKGKNGYIFREYLSY